MAGTLSIVSTPIGHLDDITLRALNTLKGADLIAAEDTRRTGKLLAHFAISTPTVSFHQHNTHSRVPTLLAHLRAGRSIALVSDAGTPVLSDPGLELVQACLREGLLVDAVPGASAPLALGVLSGFALNPWTIYGFAPARSSDRKAWLLQISRLTHAVTFFEAPHRIERTLQELGALSGNRPIVVARELTKLHQTLYRGTAASVASSHIDTRGEFTVMLGPFLPIRVATTQPSDDNLLREFGEMIEIVGLERRAALKELGLKHGLSTKNVYAAIVRARTGQPNL